MCPLGKNNSDLNNGGLSFRNGTPLTLPHDFGNPAPDSFGNPIPSSGTNQNVVDWQPSPAHFGNTIGFANPAPTVASLDVTTGGITGGTAVVITGTGFQSGAEVLFGSEPATGVVVVNSTTITCDTPAGTSGETVNVEVLNEDAQSGTLDDAFTYWSGPAITGISPNSGSTAGGTPVTLTGFNFRTGATVIFDGTSATSIVVVSDMEITCDTPASGSTGRANVVVTNSDGQFWLDDTDFSYV